MSRATLHRLAASPWATLLLLAIVGAPAAAPLMRGAPCSDDFAFHLLRLIQLDALLGDGVWISRWAPNMAFGYGYPLFNFYAPLSYYIAALVGLMTPDLEVALRLTLALGIIGAGATTYLLARDYVARLPALAAATAVMYAPYLGYDVYFRGNVAESLAWAAMPLALWAAGRLGRRDGPGWLAAAGISYAAVLLTHNVFALIFSPLLALFALAGAWGGRTGRGWRIRRVVAGLALGLALAAFFWLPALLERDLVHSDRLLVPPDSVYWNNFLGLGELFAPPQVSRPDLVNPSPPRGLGLLPALLALPALAALRRRGTVGWRLFVVAGAALFGYGLLTLAPSTPIWDAVPLLEFVQFPWRMLGPAAICLALLVGLGVEELRAAGRRSAPMRVAAYLPLIALPLSGLFWFTPRYCPALSDTTAAAIVPFEQATATIGTTAGGEYVPRTVTRYPAEPATAPFLWPDGPVVSEQRRLPLGMMASVRASAPFTATAALFAYPGWQATVDGRLVPVAPTPETGLVTFPVPAGEHVVKVRWRETPMRLAADAITAAAALMALALGVAGLRASRRHEAAAPEAGWSPADWIVALGMAGLLLVIVPRVDSPLRRPLLAASSPAQVPLEVSFANGLRLVGYDWQTEGLNRWRFDLVWAVTRPLDRPLQTTLELADEAGQLWSEKASTLPRDFREPPDARAWPAGQAVLDSHQVEPLPGTPPGEYVVALRLFDRETLALLPMEGRHGGPVTLRRVEVGRPADAPAVGALAPALRPGWRWDGIRLLGVDLDRREARPGDPFHVAWTWETEAMPAVDYRARLSLVDATAVLRWQADLAPARDGWPTMRWAPGDVWRGQHTWRLPAGLSGGEHVWRLQLCAVNGACLEPVAPIGSLVVVEPERLSAPPPTTGRLAVPIGELATLVGWEASVEDGELAVTLVWRVDGETGVAYRVFVHLLAPDGALLAQSDAEPAAWTRPTTGWLPGEFVVDRHALPWPDDREPGTLAVGIYEPVSGDRLPAATVAGDRVVLPLSPGARP